MEDQVTDILQQLENEKREKDTKNTQLATALASSSYDSSERKNLIEFQLDSTDLLSKIEHFLRGDFIASDNDGNEYWAKQTKEDLILFNDYGVNSLLLIIGNYIDKNTSLSRYDELRINEILADLGDELTKFVFCNYEKMGMNTQFKKSRFGLTIINIIHMIESSYRRAIQGKTSEDINTSKIFTQSDLMRNPGQYGNAITNKKHFNLFSPRSWI